MLLAVGKNADVPDAGASPADSAGAIPIKRPAVSLYPAYHLARLADIPEDKKRSSVKGWNKDGDGYAFRYEDPSGNAAGQNWVCNPGTTDLTIMRPTQNHMGIVSSAKSCPCSDAGRYEVYGTQEPPAGAPNGTKEYSAAVCGSSATIERVHCHVCREAQSNHGEDGPNG